MNATTDSNNTQEFSPKYLEWLFSLTIAFLTFLFAILPAMTFMGHRDPTFVTPAPVVAGGIIVGHGIKEFQGLPLDQISIAIAVGALMSILIFFVAGPTILLNNLHSFSKKEHQESKTFSFRSFFRTLVFLLALIATGMMAIYSSMMSIQSPRIFGMMKIDNTIAEERDMLTNEMAKAYPKLMTDYYVRRATNNRSTFASLSELGINQQTPFGELILQPMNNDSSITVVAVGNHEGGNTAYKNDNGSTGRLQYIMEIYPSSAFQSIIRQN
ncbi:MAG: hypothetical protein WDA22_16750 [Bacteroidota bacterium]